MTIKTWTAGLKQKVKGIGLDVWGEPDLYQGKYLLTVEWPESSCGMLKEATQPNAIQAKEIELRDILKKCGITADALSHLTPRVGRGKAWYTFYMGIHESAMQTALATVVA
ncbi:MAG: hypothetical protein AAB783_02200 [Patescibacteria group bacterium]